MDEKTKYANLKNVVVKKEKLLQVLQENKDKHDALFDLALVGYWEAAKTKLEEKKVKFSESVESCIETFNKSFDKSSKAIEEKNKDNVPFSYFAAVAVDTSWNVKFPENQASSYEKAIRMLDMSIHDEVELSEQEFCSYVLNDWGWKDSFKASNTAYISHATGSFPLLHQGYLISGCSKF